MIALWHSLALVNPGDDASVTDLQRAAAESHAASLHS